MMDSKEHAQAGNALVQWFNGQEISHKDALLVMSKVMAKIITMNVPPRRTDLEREIDRVTLQLVNDVNARTYGNKWGHGRG